MYRELIEKVISNRGNIVPAGEIFPTPTPHPRYCSLFLFDKDILPYVKLNKSVKGFKGKVYCEAVWFDIDHAKGDIHEAQQAAIQLVKRLNGEYGVRPEDLFLYFSGGKGFHIALHGKMLGFSQTDPVSTDKVKDFVRRVTAGIPCIDTVIYEPVRIFRIENSRHEKGLYKVRLTFEELLHSTFAEIKYLAKAPREKVAQVNIAGLRPLEALVKVWQNSGSYVQEQREMEVRGNLFAPPVEGGRNQKLLIQACTLFRKSELSNNAVLDILRSIAFVANVNASEPVQEGELKRIVANAERLVGEERKKGEEESVQMKSFGEWLPEWEQYILAEETPMTLGFKPIDELMKGKLKGKLGVSMGYGGSKKSLHALNMIQENLKKTGDIALYSNMEMSVPQLIDRVIDYEVEYPNYNASEAIAYMYRKDVSKGREFLKQGLAEVLGNRLQIIPTGRMTYEGYKAAIRKCRETIGNPGILVVDGLSMMGGKGQEVELYSKNSADLKQLANEENLFVLLICHVSKGAERWTRDLSRYIRGSEKILDNCDFYYTMSQIQQEENHDHFRSDIGFLSFHDKRGSGKTVDLVYGFDPHRLKLSDSEYESYAFYEPLKGGKKSEVNW